MRSLVTSKNVSWPRLIWPALYIFWRTLQLSFKITVPASINTRCVLLARYLFSDVGH